MRTQRALSELRSFARRQGMEMDHLTARDIADLMVGFYLDYRADDCDLEADGDLLLFQWGVADRGQGEAFEYNLIRQFEVRSTVPTAQNGQPEGTWQLVLSLRLSPTPALTDVGIGNHWCISPDEVDDFRAFIAAHPSTRFAEHTRNPRLHLSFEPA